MAVLAFTARLAHKLAFGIFDRLADGFAVSHLRLADVGLDTELALHAVNDDLQVQLAHTGNDGLAGLFVGLDAERRIFLSQALQRDTHFFLVNLGLGFHGLRNHGLREHHALQHDDGIRITQGLTRGHVLQANAGGDVAGANFADLFAVVGVHLHDTADTLSARILTIEHRMRPVGEQNVRM